MPNRRGITTAEFNIGVVWFLFLAAFLARWGWLGVPAWLGLTAAVLSVCHWLYRYSVEPVVESDTFPCATCGRTGRLEIEVPTKVWRCDCGARYSFRGPTLLVRRDGGPPLPYLRWKWWGEGRWRVLSPHA